MTNFLDLIKERRSVYGLDETVPITQKQIMNIIERCVYEAPSAMNAQTPRIAVLFGEQSHKFWEIVHDTLRQIVPADKFAPTEEKINSFKAGIGTVLFYEDDKTTQELQEKMPTYKDMFPQWAEHNNAILQYMIWMALTEQGLGANLQHYNPLIDEQVAKAFDIPATWRLIAQLNFGGVKEPAFEKSHLPLKERIKIFD